MSDDIFTKLDKARNEFQRGNHDAWVAAVQKIKRTGITFEWVYRELWVINGCLMWVPIDDTKEL